MTEQGIDQPRIRAAVREILLALGENPEREGLLATPDRVARMYGEIFDGINSDPNAIWSRSLPRTSMAKWSLSRISLCPLSASIT